VRKAMIKYLLTTGVERAAAEKIVRGALQDYKPADLCRYTDNIVYQINADIARLLPEGHAVTNVRGEYERLFKCYAGVLSSIKFGKDGNTLKGWPDSFDVPKKFPGRVQEIAKLKDLSGTKRPEKPWLDGLRRLIFVSDMGDVLSEGIDFEYLQQEIVNVAETEKGRRHLYLWLTKRPGRMVKFDQFLGKGNVAWPDRLVAMTSVIDQSAAKGIDQLRKLRAKIKGLSVEPLWEEVSLDLTGIDWCIVGGESGSGKNSAPFHLEWAISLQKQCVKYGTAFS
jgi:protein gp37